MAPHKDAPNGSSGPATPREGAPLALAPSRPSTNGVAGHGPAAEATTVVVRPGTEIVPPEHVEPTIEELREHIQRLAERAGLPVEEALAAAHLPAPLPNGPAAAAILASAIGSAALGLVTVIATASEAVKSLLTFYEPVGPLSGKTTVAVVIWLVAWAELHGRWRKKEVDFRRVFALTLVLLTVAVVGTFPPYYNLFRPAPAPAVATTSVVTLAAMPEPAGEPVPADESPQTPALVESSQTYTVQAGDSMRTVAERVYGDAALWPPIYQANKDLIGEDPDALRRGLELKIPPRS
jgi:nucleoid-associated protein YgaU